MSVRVIEIKWNPFIPHTQQDSVKIPEQPGVYEYYSIIKVSEKKKKKYVGETDDLNRRFREHLNDEEENLCLKKLLQEKYVWFYRYSIINDEDDRLDAELGLWIKYKHECNKEKPKGSGKGRFKIVEKDSK